MLYLLARCANNQALHDVYIDIGHTGEVAGLKVVVPMDEAYNVIALRRPASANREFDNKLDFACGGPESSLSLTFRLAQDKAREVESQTFDATCPRVPGQDASLVHLGQMHLKKGEFNLVIQNNRPIAMPSDARVQVLLVGVGVPDNAR